MPGVSCGGLAGMGNATEWLVRTGPSRSPCWSSTCIDQTPAQLSVAGKFGHLTIGLALSSRCSEAFRDRLAIQLVGQAQIRSMSGFAWFVAVAVGVPTTSLRRSNRARAKVTQM